MMENALYREDVAYAANLLLPWEKLAGKSVLITGASGLIGSFLIDVLMAKNAQSLNCRIYAVGRSQKRAEERFAGYWKSPLFEFIAHDINEPLKLEDVSRVDFVVHLASNTHPVAYATDPIGTVTANIIGTDNLLKFAVQHGAERFAFASSCEIYGENRGDTELFQESYCGYIDSNTLRAGYPESKRCGEALCQAYKKQKGLDIVIPRFARTYGPTMLKTDTKALSQFMKRALEGENIVLKSAGTQYYSYTYVADAVAGFLTILLKGENGEAYNIADEVSDIRLKDLADIIAGIAGRDVVFELPDETEKAGYSKATKARLDGSKLKMLGWTAKYDIRQGVERTMALLAAQEL